MAFRGKIAWITGASSGIGEALAKALAAHGAAVIISSRRAAELERVATEITGDALVLPFDATDYEALPEVTCAALNWRGSVDLLINNAGVSQRSLALDTDILIYRRLMEVDFFAPVTLTQSIIPHMIKSGGGHVATINSLSGKLGLPLRAGYCAAKHACIGFFDALRAELEIAYGIHVSVIIPGSIKTNIAINALAADGNKRGTSENNIDNGMSPIVAADLILSGLAKKRREIVVATDAELRLLQLSLSNPASIFDLFAAEGARLSKIREKHGATFPFEFSHALPRNSSDRGKVGK